MTDETIPRSNHLMVLVVDDQPLLLDSMVEALRLHGHYVTGFKSYGTAFEVLTQTAWNDWDVIVSDYDLKSILGTGLDLLEKVDREEHPDVRLILCSGMEREVPPHVQFVLKSNFENLVAAVEGRTPVHE